MIEVALVTLPSPANEVTGGHLFDAELAARAARHGFRIGALPLVGRTLAERALSARRVLADVRADVVVVDSIAAAALAFAPRPAAPLVALCHQAPGGPERKRLGRVLAALDASTYRRCELLVATSGWLADLLRPLGVPLETVLPGRDVPRAPGPAIDLRRGRAAAIVCVANWLWHKGVLDLADAVSRLPDEAATLHLAGAPHDGSRYGRAVARRIARADLADRVVAHGTLDRAAVARLLAGADVFALPSRGEAFGIAFAEALAAGLPVVAYRSANVPRLVGRGEGILVEPGDVEALAWALFVLALDADRRAAVAAAARARGAALPTWDETASAFFAAVRRGTHLARSHRTDGRDQAASTA